MKKIKKVLGTTALCTALLGVGTGCSLNFDPTTSSEKDDQVVVCTQTDLDTLNQRLTEKQAELNSVNALLNEAQNNISAKQSDIDELKAERDRLLSQIEDLENEISSLAISWSVTDNSGDYIYGSYGLPYTDGIVFYNNDSVNGGSYYATYNTLSNYPILENGIVKFFKTYVYFPNVYPGVDKSFLTSYVRRYEVKTLASGTYNTSVTKSSFLEFDKNNFSLVAENYLPNYDMNEYSVSISINSIDELMRFEDSGGTASWGIYKNYNELNSSFNLDDVLDTSMFAEGQYFLSVSVLVTYTSDTNEFESSERIFIPFSIIE